MELFPCNSPPLYSHQRYFSSSTLQWVVSWIACRTPNITRSSQINGWQQQSVIWPKWLLVKGRHRHFKVILAFDMPQKAATAKANLFTFGSGTMVVHWLIDEAILIGSESKHIAVSIQWCYTILNINVWVTVTQFPARNRYGMRNITNSI